MVYRIVNIFFLFALVFVFIIVANAGEHIRISFAVGLAFVFATIAFLLNWLTIDGAVSAGIFGVISYGLGDWQGAILVLTFFISASLISKDTEDTEARFSLKFRRDGAQVWANGFWFALWTTIAFISQNYVFAIAAATSIAVANADTWATEIGNRKKGKTVLITNFREVDAGTDGGVSIYGTLASIAGATIIGLLFWLMDNTQPLKVSFYVLCAGVLGSFIDSFLGASFQGKPLDFLPSSFDKYELTIDNNVVNWLSIGIASTMVLFLTLIF